MCINLFTLYPHNVALRYLCNRSRVAALSPVSISTQNANYLATFRAALHLCVLLGVLTVAFGYVVTGKCLVAANSENVITSANLVWNATYSGNCWTGIASDSSGQKVVLVATCTSGGYCAPPFSSTDCGATCSLGSAKTENYYGVTNDGIGAARVTFGGGNLYISQNSGEWLQWTTLESGMCGDPVAYSSNKSTLVFSYMNASTPIPPL